MPVLSIKTNTDVPVEVKRKFLKEVSSLMATEMNRPESVCFLNFIFKYKYINIFLYYSPLSI